MSERGDLLVDEAPHHVAEGVVLGGVEWAFHRSLASLADSADEPWPERSRLTCVEWLSRPLEMRRFKAGQPELFGDIIRAETGG
jgi:hypothetical protein